MFGLTQDSQSLLSRRLNPVEEEEEEEPEEEEEECHPIPPALELERVVFNLKRFQEDVSAPAAHKSFDKVDTQENGTVDKENIPDILEDILTELGLNVDELDEEFVAEQTEGFETDAETVISRGETVKLAKQVFAELQSQVEDMLENPDDYSCDDE